MSRRSKAYLPFDSAGFEIFWMDYPRKEAKKSAFDAWCEVQPNGETQRDIREALCWQKQRRNWRESVEFIPLAATYLRGSRWTDQRPVNDSQQRSTMSPQSMMPVEIGWFCTICGSERPKKLRVCNCGQERPHV